MSIGNADKSQLKSLLAALFVVTVASVSGPAHAADPQTDFAARCGAPGVLVCEGFDNASTFAYSSSQDDGLYPPWGSSTVKGIQDTNIKASGTSSLRFDIPGKSGDDAAGNFSKNFGAKFSQNSTFYVQFRQRFDSNMLTIDWYSLMGTFWKQAVIYDKDGVPCANIELATINLYASGIPTMYSECGARHLRGSLSNPLSFTPYVPYYYQQGASLTSGYNCLYEGEFAGIAMIRAYHDARGDTARSEILVPNAAHGTNPATAVMCGYTVKEIPTDREGSVDLEALKAAVGPQTAGLMLTNPSTLGVFEKTILEIRDIVHGAGGLLYYDGANLNAILGRVKPGAMGFDVIHMNLHKTFSTPHGGGGPGAGPVGVAERLMPFMPVPGVIHDNGVYRNAVEADLPQSIGRMSANGGNAGVLLRAYIYARMLGAEGMHRVAEFATLNANYLMAKLRDAGFELAYPTRRASHEFIVTLKKLKDETGVSAMDFAKRLLDYGFHAPTTYFPLLVPECLLIEPSETESKETLDAFIDACIKIKEEAHVNAELVKGAPYTQPVRRLDDVKAARELDLAYKPA